MLLRLWKLYQNQLICITKLSYLLKDNMKLSIFLFLSVFMSVSADGDLTPEPVRRRRRPIFYGSNAAISAYPFFVAIECYQVARSGGSIISPNLVVTAAHIFDLIKDKDYYRIRSGSDKRGRAGSEHTIQSYEIHPNYISDDGAGGCVNDIALIRIEGIFPSKFQKPIPMFGAGEIAEPDAEALVVGLGWTEEGLADHLKMVKVPIVDRSKCNETWFNGDGTPIPESVICAGGGKDRHDSCDGDSGGALLVDGRLAGILSFGYSRRDGGGRVQCGFEGVPSVYTEVARFRDWIESRIHLQGISF